MQRSESPNLQVANSNPQPLLREHFYLVAFFLHSNENLVASVVALMEASLRSFSSNRCADAWLIPAPS